MNFRRIFERVQGLIAPTEEQKQARETARRINDLMTQLTYAVYGRRVDAEMLREADAFQPVPGDKLSPEGQESLIEEISSGLRDLGVPAEQIEAKIWDLRERMRCPYSSVWHI